MKHAAKVNAHRLVVCIVCMIVLLELILPQNSVYAQNSSLYIQAEPEYELIYPITQQEVLDSDETEPVHDEAKPFNAQPVAKFVVDKPSYVIGERVTYTNLSYDPDGDAISLSWTGKQDAFFSAGQHEITLVAIDQNGNESEPYSKTITVSAEKLLFSQFEYGVYANEPGGYTKATDSQFNELLLELPEASKKVRAVEERMLLVSDSPENITMPGILYEDHISGKARLYANHVNAGEENLQLAILATNYSDHIITLSTSRQGQSAPSTYALLVGSEAVVDFLSEEDKSKRAEQSNDESEEDEKAVSYQLEIEPGETVVYRQLPTLMPQYGINAMYDVESSGELLITFVAVPEHTELGSELLSLPKLAYNGHVRGSFPHASIKWDIYPRKLGRKTIQRLMIGDGSSDPFMQGYDPLRARNADLSGNYGATYEITLHKPGRMAVLMMARGGAFKGASKVDGQFVRVPESGMLHPFQGFITVAKTDGREKLVKLEFIPPAGSSLPIMLVLYPLDERINIIVK